MKKVTYCITIKDVEKDEYKRFRFEADKITINIRTGIMGIKNFDRFYHANLNKICLIEIQQPYYNDRIILQEVPDTNDVANCLLNPYNPIDNLVRILGK